MPDSLISRRKGDHLRIVLEEDVAHRSGTLLEGIQLLHHALPELDCEEIDTSVEFFGKQLQAPLLITSMTGGALATREMNAALAQAAQRCGIALAVGSQRVLLEQPELLPDFAVRQHIPDGVLLGNIGAVQLPQVPLESVVSLMESIEADGMCVHLNAAQELCQAEGDRCFRGIRSALARLVDRLQGRVLVKETGAGLSPAALQLLRTTGVRYLDVAGRGGTSWTRVELHRAADEPTRRLGETLAEWGIPTAFSVLAARRTCDEDTCIVGSGGITCALDCARVIAAGARIAGLARALLRSWSRAGSEGVVAELEALKQELRAIMLLCGAPTISALRDVPRVYTGELRQWLETFDWFT